jgi:hypothetical protein
MHGHMNIKFILSLADNQIATNEFSNTQEPVT